MIIYLIRNLRNGKVYIGKTRGTLDQRWAAHVARARGATRTYFWDAIRKHGPEAFEREVLCTVTSLEELNIQERHYIALHESNQAEKGYNCSFGGDGPGVWSDAVKEKIRGSMRGNKNARNNTKPKSAEHRRRISLAMKKRQTAI